ncbi:MAG: tetratricopeptide repeat protein [Cyanobacteria bacterium]|nr:tetratricopeptide repeat protein [Cyanobacteriota bacterium]
MSQSKSSSDLSAIDLLVFKGVSLLNQGKTEEAEHIFLAALESDPDHAGANAFLASIEKSRDDLEKALLFLNKAISVFPAAPYLYERAEIWLASGEHEKAIEDLKSCVRNDKKGMFTQKALTLLSMSYIELGRFSEALPFLSSLAEWSPTGGVFALRSLVHSQLGNEELALNDRARAAELGFQKDDPFKSLFSVGDDAQSVAGLDSTPKMVSSVPDSDVYATAYLDSRAAVILTYRQHDDEGIRFGFAELTKENPVYVDLIYILKLAPGEPIDLRERSNGDCENPSVIDLSLMLFASLAFKTGKINIAEYAEVTYLLHGKVRRVKLKNTLAKRHTSYAVAYAIDREFGISTASEFQAALEEDWESMKDSFSKGVSDPRRCGYGLARDLFSSIYCSLKDGDIDENERALVSSLPRATDCAVRLLGDRV